MVEPADFGPRHDPTGAGDVDSTPKRRVLVERPVRSRAVVIRDVGSQHPSEMPLVEDDDVVQTLAADRPDDAFDVGILPGGARRGAHGPEPERVDGSTECRIEDRVAVVEEESRVRVVREGPADLLAGLCGGGMPRDVNMQDPAPVVSEDDEDEQDPAGERGHREEVDSDG